MPPKQAFHSLGPVLAAIKGFLCSSAEGSVGGAHSPLHASSLRLWVAYLQVVGVLLQD